MKNKFFAILGAAVVLLAAGCKKDNYDAPKSVLSGKVVFQDQPIGVRSNAVQLELWQHGYNLFSKIPVYVAQDGTFSAALFDGNYKLVRLRGNGPWADNTDSIDVRVSGATTVSVPVDPFFVVTNDKVQKAGNAITAAFNLQRVNTTRELEVVRLFVGQTQIVDQTNNVASAEITAANITDLSQPVNISINVPAALAGKDYLFARVGVKAQGIAEMYYTPVQKIALK